MTPTLEEVKQAVCLKMTGYFPPHYYSYREDNKEEARRADVCAQWHHDYGHIVEHVYRAMTERSARPLRGKKCAVRKKLEEAHYEIHEALDVVESLGIPAEQLGKAIAACQPGPADRLTVETIDVVVNLVIVSPGSDAAQGKGLVWHRYMNPRLFPAGEAGDQHPG